MTRYNKYSLEETAMSLSDALNFPFRNKNLLKILPIAIVWSLIVYGMLYATLMRVTGLIFVASIASLVASVVVSGYSIRVVQQLQQGNDTAPNVEIAGDAKRGCLYMIAGLVYTIPLLVVLAGLMFLAFASGSPDLLVMMMCGSMLLIIPVVFIQWATLNVAAVRYAAEDSASALFQFGENYKMAWSNFGSWLGLWGRYFVVGILYAVTSSIINGFFNTFTRPMMSDPTTVFWIIFALGNVISYTILLIVTLVNYHLLYQFGVKIGIGAQKMKREEMYDFNT
jgi:hypothetical protein